MPLSRRARRGALLAWLACLGSLGQASAAIPLQDDAVAPAEQAPLVRRSLLLGIARAGNRIVAVGERGHIVLSDDHGASWVQSRSVPTRNLLTAVCFGDARHGIAVGHDEIILVSGDGGNSWQRTHYAPESQQPLLDVWCGIDGRAIAVGAYGAYYQSDDSGQHWRSRRLDARPAGRAQPAASVGEDENLAGDPHLNRIVAASQLRLYIAGEAGHLYRSDDAGESWSELPSPYEGSFFGLLPLEGDALLAYGLRGHLYRSEDGGSSWQRLPSNTTAMLNDGARIGAHDVVIVGLSGALLESRDGGVSFALRMQSTRKGLQAVVPAAVFVLQQMQPSLQEEPEMIVAGEDGIRRISLSTQGAP